MHCGPPVGREALSPPLGDWTALDAIRFDEEVASATSVSVVVREASGASESQHQAPCRMEARGRVPPQVLVQLRSWL